MQRDLPLVAVHLAPWFTKSPLTHTLTASLTHSMTIVFRYVLADSALFLAFQVRDQFIDAQEENKDEPYKNDAVEIFINGDLVANDLTYLDRRGSRESFQLVSDTLGHQLTPPRDISNEDWSVRTSTTSDGYIIEFEVPLSFIDTQDGPEFTPAATGSFLLFNFNATVDDIDELVHKQTNHVLLWSIRSSYRT